MNTRIVELVIDDNLDEFGGIDGVALVARPAHEENWMTFNAALDTCCDTELKNIFEVLDDEKLEELGKLMGSLGEPDGLLQDEGYELVSIKPIRDKYDFSVGDYAKPNEKSGQDASGDRIRYKYIGPRDNKNRTFCAQMMTSNRVYRIEDIQEMTSTQANAEFGYYDIFKWRGSFNCRHFWVELTYKPTGTIINKSSVRKGVISEEIYQPQERTITDRTANAWEREGKSTEAYNPNRFTKMAEMSYNDYPQSASENACRVLKWIDEKGRDEVSGMELTGLARANQLCKREPISRETIARMASFNRHRRNSEIAPEYKGTPWKDKGYVAWLGWGGTEGVDWAMKKLEQIDTEMAGLEDACWPGYEAIGTKELNGRLVPNCVPVKMAGEKVSFDYDDTLSTSRGREMAIKAIEGGFDVYVISARNNKEGMYEITDKLGIPRSNVYATGSNKAKVEKIIELGITKHIDNNSDVVKELGSIGVQFEISTTGLSPYTDETGNKKKPVIIENFTFTSGEKHAFSVDDDKMEITGAAVVPNKFIVRVNEFNQPYYVFFSMETTKLLAQKFMKDNINNSTNIEHTNTGAKAFVSESWIVENPDNDKSNALGLMYPEGTWVITMKVQDTQLWKDIKEGKYKGFSVEGFFNEKLIFKDIQNK